MLLDAHVQLSLYLCVCVCAQTMRHTSHYAAATNTTLSSHDTPLTLYTLVTIIIFYKPIRIYVEV